MSLKIGDRVVMNEKYRVLEKNKGVTFIVRSEPWDVCGSMVVALEDFSGGYAIDGLTVLKDKAEQKE